MKGADDMIGLVLGAVLGSGLYGAEKSMQIDSRTRKRYAKAFAMEQEAHRLVEVKKQAADNAMKKLSNRKRSILITSMQNFVAVYGKLMKIDFRDDKMLAVLNQQSFSPKEIQIINAVAQTEVRPMTDKEIAVSILKGFGVFGLGNAFIDDSERELQMAGAQLRSSRVVYSQAENLAAVLDGVIASCNKVSDLLPRLNRLFMQAISYSDELIAAKGMDRAAYTENDRKAFCSCINLAVTLKKIIDAPVLTDEGKVTQETKEALAIGSQCMQDIKKL